MRRPEPCRRWACISTPAPTRASRRGRPCWPSRTATRSNRLAGYKTFVNHFHLDFTGRQRASGSLDTPFQDLVAMRSLGLNVIGLSDFHFELHGSDPGPLRLPEQKDYFDASRRASDKDFLVVPWEEPSAYFGGHYNILWPKDVYWTKVRQPGQPFVEEVAGYGKVYHTGNAEDVQKMMDAEGAYWYHAHPRTKSTTGYPDLILDKPYVKNDRYLGVAFKPGMGQDNSEVRMCDWRCFDAIDTMNNMYAGLGIKPKYVIADIDTYRKGPEDDLYANFPVNYLKIDKTPGPDDDYSPILKSLRDGNFFATTGEILIRNYSVAGTGNQRTITADVDWTFPLNFVEVVWSDGKKVDRQVISATDSAPFGTKHFAIPFDATGKAWVRFAVWDSAGNGAFVQPVWVAPKAAQTTSSRSGAYNLRRPNKRTVRKGKASHDTQQTETVPLRGGGDRVDGARRDHRDASGRPWPAARRSPPIALACDMAQYKSSSGLTAAMDQNVLTVAWNGQNSSEMRARYAIDGGQPLVRELAVRKSRRPVGGAGAEPHARLPRGQRHPPHVDAAGRSAEGRRRGIDAGGDCQEPLVRLLGCAAGDEAGARNHRAAAQRVRHQARDRVVPHHVVQREDRRRGARGDVSRAVDGHLLRRPAVHGVSRHEPSSHGRAGDHQGGVDRLQVRGGPEGILDRR